MAWIRMGGGSKKKVRYTFDQVSLTTTMNKFVSDKIADTQTFRGNASDAWSDENINCLSGYFGGDYGYTVRVIALVPLTVNGSRIEAGATFYCSAGIMSVNVI